MKILIFSLVYYPRFVGGAEVAVKEITDRLGPDAFSAEGGPVFGWDMVTLRSHGELATERMGNIAVHRVGVPLLPFWVNKLLFPFLACCRGRKLHRRARYDAIWSIMANRAGFAALFFKMKFPNVPFLLTLQEGDDMQYSLRRMGLLMPFLYPLWKRIFKKADRIQSISHFLADWARYQGASAPIEVVPNGVDIKNFQLSISNFQREETRGKLGIRPEERVVITTSRLVPKNGIGDLIAAMQYLPEHVKLLILGSGPLLKNLQQTTDNLQLKNRVQFLGYVPHEELPKYLHASDVFCRPSLSEGLGNSFLEAMAAGLPVVATPVGGIPDFLQDPSTRDGAAVTGLFCKVGDSKDIAEKIGKLLTDDALRQQIIISAQRMVAAEYDWQRVTEHMKEIFRKLQLPQKRDIL